MRVFARECTLSLFHQLLSSSLLLPIIIRSVDASLWKTPVGFNGIGCADHRRRAQGPERVIYEEDRRGIEGRSETHSGLESEETNGWIVRRCGRLVHTREQNNKPGLVFIVPELPSPPMLRFLSALIVLPPVVPVIGAQIIMSGLGPK